MSNAANPWDTYAEAYAVALARRLPADQPGGMMMRMIELLGDLSGKSVLDAGCGSGVLARVLARHGARVTGIDLSPRLVAMAREQDAGQGIDYRVGNLSEPQPEFTGAFDAIGSYLVLNDVADHRGFAATLADFVKPGGRIALVFNNPYSSVVREHISDYFASGSMGTYLGLREQGIEARYYHRTLGEYLDAFLDTGLRLARLVDVPDTFGTDMGIVFPRFMILAFEKPA